MREADFSTVSSKIYFSTINFEKMKFTGQVSCGSSRTIHNEIIEGYFPGKRDKGRQQRTWTDDLKNWTDIKTFYTLKRTADDSEKWKFMVSNHSVEDGIK